MPTRTTTVPCSRLSPTRDDLVEALVAAIACARERIDLRRHEGAHPRIGAADVVPVVPDAAGRHGAGESGPRSRWPSAVGGELDLPVFVYGELAPGRGPAFFRAEGLEGLRRRVESGELAPEFGPARIEERSGAVLVGARRPLIAFNVNLRGELESAREIASAIRERDGGFRACAPSVSSCPRAGFVQVSMNVEDWEAAALHDLVAAIEREAAARGAEVVGSELVGLMPGGAAAAAAGAALRIDGFDASRVLELRLLEPDVADLE